jgi:hypothetical protein
LETQGVVSCWCEEVEVDGQKYQNQPGTPAPGREGCRETDWECLRGREKTFILAVGVLCGCRELFVKRFGLVRCWDLISGIVMGAAT